MPINKPLLALASLALLSGCSVFSGDRGEVAVLGEADALRESQDRASDLEVEVARLKSENARLANLILALERENAEFADAAEAEQDEAASEIASAQPLRAEPAPQAVDSLVVPPASEEIVVAEADAPELRSSDVPFERAPRLVQPTDFNANETVFENEAIGEIETASVLFGVHLASYRKVAEAREGWSKLQRENPEELGLLEPRVEWVNIPDKGAFLRLVGGGFSSRDRADSLCEELKAKGLFCSVSGFGGESLSLAGSG